MLSKKRTLILLYQVNILKQNLTLPLNAPVIVIITLIKQATSITHCAVMHSNQNSVSKFIEPFLQCGEKRISPVNNCLLYSVRLLWTSVCRIHCMLLLRTLIDLPRGFAMHSILPSTLLRIEIHFSSQLKKSDMPLLFCLLLLLTSGFS